jgi:hypothetical protein
MSKACLLGALGALMVGAGAACSGPAGPLVLVDPCWDNPSSSAPPAELGCTGLYDDWEAKRVAWNVRGFSPGTPLWSDGTQKQRWLYLPPGQPIDATDPDEWVFPVGTKVWKEFSIAGRRVETRLFAKVNAEAGGWQRATYLWSPDGTAASRLDGGVPNWEGTGYEVPPVTDCDKCHNGRRDRLLGVEAVGLGEAAASGLRLETLVREGRIVPAVDPAAAQLPDSMPPAERAALSWLHVNCGVSCHNRAADARAMGTNLFLRLELGQVIAARQGAAVGALDPIATTVEVSTRTAKWPGLRITAGAPAQSQLYRLASSRGPDQMPPLLSHVPDPEGTRLLRAWIESLVPTPPP